ncbi:MAG TPA: hypothetical protein PKC43_00410 [Phycisphaerales bacterium]|nr:hypothetical protein [Phycisphaerales bacterium]HMP35887.1 hypothetical protein [Phycisphaerales bacterium]
MIAVVTCPSCWHRFDPGAACFIAEHAALIGDPVLGPDESLRFHPTRLDGLGRALDPEGALCSRVACPRCHLELPHAALELRTLMVSAIGAPASGKSHLLAAATWRLRRLAAAGGPEFEDADPTLNATLHAQESALFLPCAAARDGFAIPVLPKTETGGSRLYREVLVQGQVESLPVPLLFVVGAGRERRLLVLQDNAGEHFLPGRDRAARDATGHLGRGDAILVVLDPLQDHRFRRAAGVGDGAAGIRIAERQELVVTEAAGRIRRLSGIESGTRIARPVVVALTKADLWQHLLPDVDLASPPLRSLRRETAAVAAASLSRVAGGDAERDGEADAALSREAGGAETRREPLGLDAVRLRQADERCSALLAAHSPEIAAALNAAFEHPRLVPVSALGRSPIWIEGERGASLGVPAKEIQPRWAEVPLLMLLACAERSSQERGA